MVKICKYYLSGIFKTIFTLLTLLVLNTNLFAATIDWTGQGTCSSGVILLGGCVLGTFLNTNDWNNANNWSLSRVPVATDAVQIGVNSSYAIVNMPIIGLSGTTTPSCASLTFGYYGPTTAYTYGQKEKLVLTVNSGNTLTVTGNVTQNHYASLGGTPYNYINTVIAGLGTMSCQGNFIVGDATQPATSVADVTQVSIQITQLTVTGNVTLNSTGNGAVANICYPWFSVEKGQTTLLSPITFTTNGANSANSANGFSTLNANAPGFLGYGQVTADNTASSPSVLELKNATPITKADKFYVYFTFGGNNGTVIYDATSGNQTIYTANEPSVTTSATYINTSVNTITATSTTLPAYSYYNLTFSGASIKIADANSSLGTPAKSPAGLTVGNTWTTSGGAVNLNTNNPTVTVTGSWGNSTSVTQQSGDINIGGGLTNSSGGVLNLGIANLSIGGNYLNNSGATYTQSTGTTNFNGTTQSLTDGSAGGTLFNNVTFSNSGTKTISSGSFGVSTIGVLNVLGASTIFAPGGNLTMYASSSSPLAYAQIGPLTGKISGNVNYQVYFTGGAGYRNYRSMAAPVYNNTTTYSSTNGTYSLGSFMNPPTPATGFIITGAGGSTNGFDKSSNNGATLRLYNPASNIYTFVTSISPTTPALATGTAFYMYFRGSRIPGTAVTATDPFGTKTNRGTGSYAVADPVMYTYTGVPNQGNVVAASLGATDTKFYFVANPYAATLDANAIINSAFVSGTTYFINTKAWIWSPSAANYAIYNFSNPAMSVNGGKQYIVPGQGFFIQANTTTAKTLTLIETMKSVTNNANAARFLYQAEPLAVADPPIFRLKFVKDSILSDEIAVGFIDSSKATLDTYDAIHLEGSSLTLSSLTTDNKYLAVDARPFTGSITTMQLYVTPDIDTTYTLKLSYKNAAINNYKISLKDSLLNTTTDISNNGYSFSITAAQANTYAKRFKLIIEPKPVPPLFTAFTGKLDAVKKVSLQWNNAGAPVRINYQVQRSTDKKTFINIGTPINAPANNPEISYQTLDPNPQIGLNYYRLVQTDMFNNNNFSDTVTIANNPGLLNGITKNGFVLYSNPVKDVVSIVSDKSYPGTVKLQIYNNLGQVQTSQSFTGMDAQVAIQENVSNLKYGVYTAHIENNNKEMVVIKFIKQ